MIEEYFSRLKEVLQVTGKLTKTDLEYCKLLTEQNQLKSGSSDVPSDEEICKMFPMDVLNHDEITMAKREAAKWARDFKAKNRDEGIELTDEIISLIYIGKKMVCEEDCKCHAECNIADDYVNQLKKKN